MSDTIRICFPVTKCSDEDYKEANYPLQRSQITNQDGEVVNAFSTFSPAVSPLTGAKFKIKAVFSNDGARVGHVVGYLVDINVPACTIGNNVLLQNLVWSACRLTMHLLKHWLLKNGCSVAGANAITLENARLESVTLTYLFACEDHTEALTRSEDLLCHGEVLHNPRGKSNAKNEVFQVGTSSERTVLCKPRDFNISAYVKSQTTSAAFAKFPNTDIENSVFAEGEKRLRVEIKYGKKWLKDHDRVSPSHWKGGIGQVSYQQGVAVIRDYLRLDENLRTRRPKPSDIEKLSPSDQRILRWHLAGKDVRQHELIQEKGNQYFSAVKQRLLKKLKIDITIPWQDQSNKLYPKLSNLIKYTGPYRPPKELGPHSLCFETVRDVVVKLKELNRQLILGKKKTLPTKAKNRDESGAIHPLRKSPSIVIRTSLSRNNLSSFSPKAL